MKKLLLSRKVIDTFCFVVTFAVGLVWGAYMLTPTAGQALNAHKLEPGKYYIQAVVQRHRMFVVIGNTSHVLVDIPDDASVEHGLTFNDASHIYVIEDSLKHKKFQVYLSPTD